MKTPEQEPTYKVTVVDDQHPNGIPLEQWTPEDMAYRPGALVRTEPDPTPKQLAALGWQSIECPFCGTSGAQAFPKPEQALAEFVAEPRTEEDIKTFGFMGKEPECDWEGIAADQAMTIALMKSEQEPVAWVDLETSSIYSVGSHDKFGSGDIPLYIAPPKRELKSTADMMMELADRLGELPDDVDPRAWEHLLVYAPKRHPLTDEQIIAIRVATPTLPVKWGNTVPFARAVLAADASPKRKWVELTDRKIDAVTKVQWGGSSGQPLAAHRAYARAVETELKELNHD
jgi:hypothetical protein